MRYPPYPLFVAICIFLVAVSAQSQGLLIEQASQPLIPSNKVLKLETRNVPDTQDGFDQRRFKDWTINCRTETQTPACTMTPGRDVPTAVVQGGQDSAERNGAAQDSVQYVSGQQDAQPFKLSISRGSIGTQSPSDRLGILQTPHNVLLPAGVEIKIDKGHPFRLVIRSCHIDLIAHEPGIHASCVAPFLLKGRLLQAMKAGGTMTVQATQLDGQILSQSVSLAGFTAAWNIDWDNQK